MKKFKVVFNNQKLKTIHVEAESWGIDIPSGFTYFHNEPDWKGIPVAGINSSSICAIVEVEDGKRK